MDEDLHHLRLLSTFHYVVAGVLALFSLFPVIHLVVGIVAVSGGLDGPEGIPVLFGLFFIVFALVFILCGLSLSVCVAVAGGYLRRQERYTFCLVIAALLCMFMPFGTVLGVFTIVVLMKPSVKELFQSNNVNVPRRAPLR